MNANHHPIPACKVGSGNSPHTVVLIVCRWWWQPALQICGQALPVEFSDERFSDDFESRSTAFWWSTSSLMFVNLKSLVVHQPRITNVAKDLRSSLMLLWWLMDDPRWLSSLGSTGPQVLVSLGAPGGENQLDAIREWGMLRMGPQWLMIFKWWLFKRCNYQLYWILVNNIMVNNMHHISSIKLYFLLQLYHNNIKW